MKGASEPSTHIFAQNVRKWATTVDPEPAQQITQTIIAYVQIYMHNNISQMYT